MSESYCDLIKSKQSKSKGKKSQRKIPHFSHCGNKMLRAEFSLSDFN